MYVGADPDHDGSYGRLYWQGVRWCVIFNDGEDGDENEITLVVMTVCF